MFLVLIFGLEGVGQLYLAFQMQNGSGFVLDEYQGILSLIVAWGLWKAKGWGWTLFLVTTLVGLVVVSTNVLGQPSMGQLYYDIFGIALDLVFIYYVTRRRVMDYFGKQSIASDLL